MIAKQIFYSDQGFHVLSKIVFLFFSESQTRIIYYLYFKTKSKKNQVYNAKFYRSNFIIGKSLRLALSVTLRVVGDNASAAISKTDFHKYLVNNAPYDDNSANLFLQNIKFLIVFI